MARKKSKKNLVDDVVDSATSLGEDVVDAVSSIGDAKPKKKRSLVKRVFFVGVISAVVAAVVSYRKAAQAEQPGYGADSFSAGR